MDKTVIKQYLFVAVFVALILGAKWYIVRQEDAAKLDEKVYVAVEGDGKLAVIDPLTLKVAKSIDLTEHAHGGPVVYHPHNVQIAPDGTAVWVTANAGTHDHGYNFIPRAHADTSHNGSSEEGQDQVVVIDPASDEIVKRINIGTGLHLAHVVLTADGKYAYVTAQVAGKIYKINAKTYLIEQTFDAGSAAEPHGLRLSHDSSLAYISLLGAKSLAILDTRTGGIKNIKLEGAAVQSAATKDGKYVLVSIFDKKSVAVYDVASQKISYIKLPAESKGPVQLYPTPDSQFVYVADQGNYFGQPNSKYVYKLDLANMKVSATIDGGTAPHGTVVSKDGSRVYVTNLVSGDVSVINTSNDQIIQTIKVGKEPNGISVWSKQSGGTP